MKTDIFVGADLKPYNFHLLPPLHQNTRLIKLIEDNGGMVISDTTNANAIILASKDHPIPNHLKAAYVYSYEVVVESANTGVQQNFNDYLIHVPTYHHISSNENQQRSQQQQTDTNNKNGDNPTENLNNGNSDVNVDMNVDDYDFSNFESALSKDAADFNKELRQITGDLDVDDDEEEEEEDGGEDEDDDEAGYDHEVPELDEDEEAIVNRQQMEQLRQIQRYQEQQRQQKLKNLDLEKNTQFQNHNQQQNTQHGHSANMNMVPHYEDDSGVRYFTEEEDKVLLEEVRKRHWMGIKGHGLYAVICELPFFKMKRRTAASLRERMRTLKYNVGYVYQVDKFKNLVKDKNGNYIKQTNFRSKLMPFTALDDMILCKTIMIHLTIETDSRGYETVVFPTNFYDRFADVYFTHSNESWRQRYKNYIQIFGIMNYLKYYIIQVKSNKTPQPVNVANKEWLEARKECKKLDVARMFLPDVPVEDDFVHENMDYLELPADDDRVFNYENPFKVLNQRKRSQNSKRATSRETETESMNSEPLFQTEEPQPQLQIESSSQIEQNDLVGRYKDSAGFEADHKNEHIQPLDINVEGTKNLDDAVNALLNNSQSMDDYIDSVSLESGKFIDEPTTRFRERKFRKLQKKLGDPVKFDKENVDQLIADIKKVFAPYGEKIQPKELSESLAKLGVEKYYLIYLTLRCNSSALGILDSIINYIRTNGKQLLVMRPGIWSDKANELFAKDDPKLNQLLIAYHGEKNFRKYSKHFSKVNL
ncbi:hypothetical protein CANINC_001043 [Pichia inconspicua]|uniref:Rap1 DNA-binding domain-containing protein n=1 Tax=Pichia inconspicua TaxID=52247 RepID=A0A4T0X4G7_9ASCO|nr:hypothetical protein CANINC_001043 [[Candida] inconspicua]